jgi:Ca2+-binding EF-hand superfamily protein
MQINNLKNILASSPKTLEQAFNEVDKENKGRITNLMFKKAFRNLNIALTSK